MVASSSFNLVHEKIKHVQSHKPFFFPVWSGINTNPIWNWSSILLSYSALPRLNELPRRLPYWDYHKTIIMAESGAITKSAPSSRERCFRRQLKALPDIVLSLDKPTKGRYTKLSLKEMKERVEASVENAVWLMRKRNKLEQIYHHQFAPMAVLHCIWEKFYDRTKSEEYYIDTLKWCTRKCADVGYQFYAHGGISIDSSKRKSLELLARSVKDIRNIIGNDAWLHLLGVGDIRVLKVVKEYIDSFDNTTPSKQAAYKSFITPPSSSRRTVHLGRKRWTTGSIKYQEYATNDSFEFQNNNFNNYIERLKKELWELS